MKYRSVIKIISVATVSVLSTLVCYGQTSPTTVLHPFTGNPDGKYPLGLVSIGNTLYGTTEEGGIADSGSIGNGTVFCISSDGSTYSVLHTFTARQNEETNPDGAVPLAGLLAAGCNLYGTTADGGATGNGTVFLVSTDGVFTVLYNFLGGTNGFVPLGTLTLSDGTLYGTTEYGGNQVNQYGVGGGTVFSVGTNGSDFTVLHSFTVANQMGNSQDFTNVDGSGPYSGLVLLGNTLYGTTILGGTGGRGTVFAVNTNGTGFAVLHDFAPTTSTTGPFTNIDGGQPETTLLLSGNTLYGTTSTGGSNGLGTVFAVETNGSNFIVLHAFDGTDGEYPNTQLALSGNTLYGATDGGGTSGYGTVFAINTNGSSFAVLQNLAVVGGTYPDPNGSLVVFSNMLYGTTANGGARNDGTVFSLQLSTAPTAAIQPESLTVIVGNSASFSATASGTPPLSFQWLFNGTNIPRATNSTLTLSNAFPANQGSYAIVVTNFYGSVTSAPAMLMVSPLALTAPQSAANGQFQFSFSTATGVNYTVQCCTSLSQAKWMPLLTFEGNGGPITVIDPNAAESSQCYYRIVLSEQ